MERRIPSHMILKISLTIFTSYKGYPGQLEMQYIISPVYDGLNVFISDIETIALIESNKPDNNRLVPSDDTI
jgi:hypothetical protein